MSLLELFVEVDDFCQAFELWAAKLLLLGKAKRGPKPVMSASEVMILLIHFPQAGYRDFKSYYQRHVREHLHVEFPKLVSHNRFVELIKGAALLLCAYLGSRLGRCTSTTFVDSTSLTVCHNRRISRHKVFKDFAARGKTTMGWFYGFKLHVTVNEQGELLAVHLTPGKTDDRRPLEDMTQNLFGKLFGDKGYISQALFQTLFERGLELITALRKNMKGQRTGPEGWNFAPLWCAVLSKTADAAF